MFSAIQFVSMLAGCYFVVFMFQDGILSYGAFYLVSFLVSLTCVKKPMFSLAMLFIFFAGLTAFLGIFVIPIPEWFGELLIAFLYMILLVFGTFLNYRRHLSLFLQEKEIHQMNKKLEILSQTDALTGIFNRRKSMVSIEEHIAFFKRYGDPFCVAILDIDRFKRVNDKFGHIAGDVVLKQFAQIVQAQLRKTDIFGRWGGEEFIILLPKSDTTQAHIVLEKIRKYVESFDFEAIGHITVSAGFCMYKGEKTASKIIAKADNALYIAKENGRNQTQMCK